MDWFSWLSRTTLDPLLTYEYGLLFARNGLRIEHVSHFNHDFLQNIGISVAKHRLEILKLAKSDKQEEQTHKKPSAGIVSAFNKTKNCLRKCVKKLVLNHRKSKVVFGDTEFAAELTQSPGPRLRPRPTTRNVSFSGPLDGRATERLMTNSKSLKLSGPLDRKERPMFLGSPNVSGPLDGTASNKSPKHNGLQGKMMRLIPPIRSPKRSGPLEGRDVSPRICCRCNRERPDVEDDYHSLWVSMFYDLKPT